MRDNANPKKPRAQKINVCLIRIRIWFRKEAWAAYTSVNFAHYMLNTFRKCLVENVELNLHATDFWKMSFCQTIMSKMQQV